jgi:hypothetical protein
MPVVADQNTVGLTSPQGIWIQGWDQQDEPDNAQDDGMGGYGPCITPSALVSTYNAIKAKDTTRPVFLNFGQGVANTTWVGRGSCTGDTDYYGDAAPAGDILSFDVYPIADYAGKLEMVATGMDNLVSWSNGKKIIWNFIEGSAIGGGDVPTAAQERAEVWMSLIHGSQGIMYFVHEFSPAFREDGIFNHADLVQAVTDINGEIASLAAVLNSPTISGGVTVSSSAASVPVDTMEKHLNGAVYVFAVAMRDASTVATFTVPGTQTGSATVIGESRQVAIAGGTFHDNFSGYAVHLYQIDGD